MITVDSEEFQILIELCQDARIVGDFDKVMNLLEPKLDEFDDAARLEALVQMVYACDQAGYRERCLAYAEQIKALNPALPLVQRLLD
jgi:hypothetical protein